MTIKQKFKQSVRCGTGEAYFILMDNPNTNFSSIILDAAKTNYAYDAQSEGSRAKYIGKLIEASPQKEKLVKDIIKALNKKNDDTWSISQLFGLNELFAKQGYNRAKNAIYKRYKKNEFESDWLGQEEIVELDGVEGLKIIAETRGKSLRSNKDDWEGSFFVDWVQEENPSIKVYEELKKASKTNKFIKKYYSTILKSKKEENERKPRPKVTYETILENINQLKIVPASPRTIQEFTKSEIKKLANAFIKEKESAKQEKYLRIFSRRKFPLDYNPILEIAKGSNRKNTRLIEFACESLKYFKGKDIRRFALEKLRKTNKPAEFLYLLVSNYKKGDSKLLTQITTKFKNQDIIHGLIYGLLDIYKNNRTKECNNPLEIIYRKMTCGIHRLDLLKVLHENNALSKQVLREMEYDSYDEINELYYAIKNG